MDHDQYVADFPINLSQVYTRPLLKIFLSSQVTFVEQYSHKLRSKLSQSCLSSQIRQQMVEAAQGAELDSKSSEDINRLLMTLADYKGVLVKLADRVAELQHSVRTNAPYCERSAREALEVFAPMANRLGVWSLKAMLEDLAFKVNSPSYHGIA